MKVKGTYGYMGQSGANMADRPPHRYETPMVLLALQAIQHVHSLQALARQLKDHGCRQGQWEHLVERLRIEQTETGLTWVSPSTGMRRYTAIPPEHAHES